MDDRFMEIIRKEVPILFQEEIGTGIYDMRLDFPEAAAKARPGQFVTLYCRSGDRLLPRPISICQADAETGSLRLVYRLAGEGTREFSRLQAGDVIDVMGPLGNGFSFMEGRAIVVGGGIGIPPMLELARRLPGPKSVVLGYKDQIFLKEDFERLRDGGAGADWREIAPGRPGPGSCEIPSGIEEIAIATEDGSCGIRGTVLDALKERQIKGDVLYACGPMPMLKALADYASREGIRAQISLEERMACGIGACLACVCSSRNKDDHTNVHNKRVCREGPVFDAEEVVFA